MATAALIGGSLLGAASSRSSSRRAAASQERGQQEAIAAQQQAAAQTRRDAIPLFQSAQQNALAGFGGALDIFNQSIPQQQQQFQAGSVGAQQALLSGLPQGINAILGRGIDLGALQPQTLETSQFAPQQLPEFTSINQSLGINPPPVGPQPIPTGDPFDFRNFGGFNRGSGFNFNRIP